MKTVFDLVTHPNLRDEFNNLVEKVFGDVDKFLDLIDGTGTCEFDVAVTERPSGEYYIINRQTGEYINWYKYTHLGRDIHMNFDPSQLEDFLVKFKKSCKRED